ncbi:MULTISPECIES: hypothetical protein [Embleya]|uniref:Uncharacterized protein n=2 Tax=Embleya TaxID=2699295 RepID=A0A1T3NQ12_9ACTN|nr:MULTISPECIES: hypothetical protein [Embleya]MYS87432.1 hypothetical protein [Streptomyces sp. SID5474]OPC78916.1 hypothetical protein B4N89_32880 [Embleya scabrispora]WSY45924.1 hypothetical protein OG948_46845 [Embleya sp. NBC_00888]GCD94666.1 hypothetical protein EHYA_02335 [Embleya hyalina]
MATSRERWTVARLAAIAGLPSKVGYEARDRNVLHPTVLSPSDVLPLLTFEALRRISWPGENYARNTPQRLRLWEHLAIEHSRVGDLADVDPMTGLYVHPSGADLAVRPSEHAALALRFVEENTPYQYLTLGAWAQQALRALAAEQEQVGRRHGAA